ncbi:MAG: phosphotransferase [Chloroflexi bacterium]|nr:phosphotransferase [Chloroflexota bacterium]
MTTGAIPGSPEQLSDEWLTAALRESGVLRRARVAAHTMQLAETQGAAAVVARLQLEYDPPEPGAPASLVAKFASPYDPIRALMQVVGGYAREVEFYRCFGADPGIPVPRCYHAELDTATGVFVLLLEDLSACRIADHTAPSVEDTELAVRHLAPFHAKWWNHPRLRDLPFLRYPGGPGDQAFLALGRAALAAALPAVTERFGAIFPATLRILAERIIASPDLTAVARTQVVEDGVTLVHGDFHPGQLFFPSEAGGRFAVFDWQTVNAGNGGDDLARIIASGLTTEQREASEMRLIELYHALLLDHGVTGYGIDACREGFRRGLLMNAMMNVVAAPNIDPDLADSAGVTMTEISDILFGRAAAAIEAHHILDDLPA